MIETIIEIARQAGQIVLSHYKHDSITFDLKDDQSPVTIADHDSHQFLVTALTDLKKGPVISEEGFAPEDYSHLESLWLVDPLDGTKDFLAKNDEFAICIALLRHGQPTLGVIYGPATDELYWAEQGVGCGAFIGGQARPPTISTASSPLVMMRSRFHDDPRVEPFKIKNGVSGECRVGSALKFGRMLVGEANIYPRFSGSSEWDIAAGHALLKQWGGHLLDWNTGKELHYFKPNYRNGPFLALGAGMDPARFLEGRTP